MLEDKNFEELANEWFAVTRNNIKISTVGAYGRILKTHLIPYFGEMRFADITPETVEQFILNEREKGFSNRHISNILTQLRMITRYASEKYSCFNPAVGVKAPKDNKKSARNDYTNKDREKILKILTTDIDSTKAAALLVLHTGLHVGELCALKWENIDLDAGTVRIENTLQRVTLEDGGKVYLYGARRFQKTYCPYCGLSLWDIKRVSGCTVHILPFRNTKTYRTEDGAVQIGGIVQEYGF